MGRPTPHTGESPSTGPPRARRTRASDPARHARPSRPPGPSPIGASNWPTLPQIVDAPFRAPTYRVDDVLLDRYTLRREIGRGGMGVVWHAWDAALGRDIALKLLPPETELDAVGRERLRREAKAAIRLQHEHIVRLFHFHSSSELSFLEMELVDGPSLSQYLAEHGPQEEDVVRRWLVQVCLALQEAHGKDVIHLDIKPGNILLAPDGSVKLTDFGIARVLVDTAQRVTRGFVSGTLPYMPPEQLRGKYCDGRTDLYALGVTAYELLTGRTPFFSGDIAHQHLQEAPPPIPGQAPRLWPVIERLLAKEPGQRFQTAGELAHALNARIPAADIQLAVMFTDVGESTALTEKLGDAGARRLLRAHEDTVRDAVGACRGEIVKSMGDGFMVAFELPQQAVNCAADIQRRLALRAPDAAAARLAVRIGIHCGPVIRESGDLFGQTVNLAARVMAKARPGQVLLSDAVRERTQAPAAWTLLDRGLFGLRGVAQRTRLFELTGVHDTGPAATPRPLPLTPAGVASPFVGRRAEMEQLEQAFEQARQGHGGFVVLAGEPGIGKSRLAREFAALIGRRRVRILSGRCFEEGAVPWQPVVEWLTAAVAEQAGLSVPPNLRADLAPLRTLSPELRPWLRVVGAEGETRDPAEQRERLLAALTSLIVHFAADAPLVLLLDDVQWADQSTLDFLRHLGRRLVPDARGGTPGVLVVATSRQGGLDAAHPAGRVLHDLEAQRLLVRIPVEGLPRAEVATLVHDLYGGAPGRRLVDFVFTHSQGNPYFAEEIYRDLAEQAAAPGAGFDELLTHPESWSVSRRVKDVIGKRLERLADDCLDALQVAALIGARFRFDVLAAAAELAPDTLISHLEQALAARLIRESAEDDGIVYAFEHALAAETLAERGSLARRRSTHVRIAGAMEHVFGPDVEAHAVELARQLVAAGELAPPDRVYRFGRLAGDQASTLYAYDQATRFYQAAMRALERLPPPDPAESAGLQHRLTVALGHVGAVDQAREYADAAIEAYEAHGAEETADRVRLDLARALKRHAQHKQALDYLAPLQAKAGESTAELYTIALGEYVLGADYAGHSEDMLSAAERLEALAKRTRHRELAEWARRVRRNWLGNHTNDLHGTLVLTRQLVRDATRRRDRAGRCVDLGNVAFRELLTGRVGAALVSSEEAVQLAQETDVRAELINATGVQALCHCFRGDWRAVDEAWGSVQQDVGRVAGAVRLGLLVWARVRTDLWLGRNVSQVPSVTGNYAGMSITQKAVTASTLLRATEDGDGQSRKRLIELAAHVPADGRGLMWFITAQALTAAAANLDEADIAAQWYEALAPMERTLYLTCSAIELGRVAALHGWRENGLKHFNAALRLCRREGLRPLRAIALYEKARLYQRQETTRDRARARQLLEQAAGLFDELGMVPYLQRIERIGEAPPG